jgi:hypothetical protein
MQTASYTNGGGIIPVEPMRALIACFDDTTPTIVLRIPKQSPRTPTTYA